MAGGKLTPRQKMINLMYLVFIAMLALNMSKEVLSAFGLMNEKFEVVNKDATEYNGSLYADLESKATEKKEQFGVPFEIAKKVKGTSDNFFKYIDGLKKDITKGIPLEKGKLPYESMDKGEKIDQEWFAGDGYSKKGTEVINTIEKYKADLIAALGNDVKYKFIVDDIKTKFSTANVKDGEGISHKYLDYHFKGFPAIASLTKLSAMQNDVKKTEQDIYNGLIGNTNAKTASMKNYKAIVITDKNAFFEGETVTGRVVLGRYDESTVPTSVVVNGQNVKIENGQAILKLGAGGVGEHDIKGKFTFLEDGKAVPIDIDGKYVVVPQPKSANISADKMNVVYRGLPNPMTISFAGISNDKVSASAPGLSKSGNDKYMLKPGSGAEVTVTVTGKIDDKTVSDKKVFRIKNIPGPAGSIGGEIGSTKGAKSRLEVSEVKALLKDFVYDLDCQVQQFTFKIQGQPAVIVNGNKVNAQCKAAMARAGRGDQVTITDIKYKFVGVDGIIPPKCTPFVYEIQ